MALTREKKQKIIENLKEKIKNQKVIVFTNFKGLKVKDFFGLREELKKIDSEIVVAKKTLVKIAFKENNIEVDEKDLGRELALVFGYKDEISPIKISYKFSCQNENFELLGGIFEREFIGKEQIIELAKLPSKEELLAKLVGGIRAPIFNFVQVLQGNIKGLLYVLTRVKT